jgi:hypothetical protein
MRDNEHHIIQHTFKEDVHDWLVNRATFSRRRDFMTERGVYT